MDAADMTAKAAREAARRQNAQAYGEYLASRSPEQAADETAADAETQRISLAGAEWSAARCCQRLCGQPADGRVITLKSKRGAPQAQRTSRTASTDDDDVLKFALGQPISGVHLVQLGCREVSSPSMYFEPLSVGVIADRHDPAGRT